MTESDSNNDGARPRANFWIRRVTNVYTAAAAGVVGVGGWWLKSSGQWSAEGLKERRGLVLPPAPKDRPIWIHAASMGEVRVATQFARELTARGEAVVASSMTESGHQLCNQLYPEGTACFRVPFDLPRPIRRVLKHFNPKAMILVETEWWPNMLLQCQDNDVPVFVINGRLSPRAFGRYRLGRTYWNNVLAGVDFFYMRSREDADRLRQLGIDPPRVRAMGTLKAISIDDAPAGTANSIVAEIADSGPVWVAGCSRPGEEEVILSALDILRAEFPTLQLWLAPRHPDRFDTVAQMLEARRIEYQRLSEISESGAATRSFRVLLIDRMGLLAELYRHASVAFVGGSLKPFGGHNPLEPALHGVPVAFGQHMDDQRDAADILLTEGMAREVWGAESLAMVTADFLRTPAPLDERKARAAVLLERLEQIRARVADDLCERLKAHGHPQSAGQSGAQAPAN